MGFDFTIAVTPSAKISLDSELQYIKSALLYADKIRLISPVAYMFNKYTDVPNYNNDLKAIRLLKELMLFVRAADENSYLQNIDAVNEMSRIIQNKKYKSIPLSQRIVLKKQLQNFVIQISDIFYNLIGDDICKQLNTLIKNDYVVIETFDKHITDTDLITEEYFKKLKDAINNSYPLFDKQSSDLIKSAVKSNIINFNDIDKLKNTHAGLVDNYIQRLPSFEQASIAEIIDIKEELSSSVINFRSKMIKFAETIQSQPWDSNFLSECSLLYDKEVAPAILEIEEATNDGLFIKNLGKKFLTDENSWKTTGGIALSIAAGGILNSFASVGIADKAALTTGGAIAATKIAQAYHEYSQQKKLIEKNDLYFYYATGKRLEDNNSLR